MKHVETTTIKAYSFTFYSSSQ